ncbi:MAG: ATP-binding protein [Paracoccaceae bacterium]
MSLDNAALWQSLPVPSFTIDSSGVITDLNPVAEVFMNLSARKLIGRGVFEALVIDTPLDEVMGRVRADHSAVFVTNVNVSGDKILPQQCNIQIAAIIGSQGDILMMVIPSKIAVGLGQSIAAKTTARSAIGMSEMLAHEIKNPLAGITGAAQLLAMNLKAKDREMTDLIVAESRRIVALLDQVEQFGNVQPPQQSITNIHDILDRARKSASVGFAANMSFKLEYDPSLPATLVDADQIMQVFLNLFKNAAEAAGVAGGKITVRTFYDHGLRLRRLDGSGNRLPLQVEIIDDGPGLPPDIAADVFEPFVSGHENGTGLGLALVNKIISDHDSWIALESVPGHTVFRLSFAVAEMKSFGSTKG